MDRCVHTSFKHAGGDRRGFSIGRRSVASGSGEIIFLIAEKGSNSGEINGLLNIIAVWFAIKLDIFRSEVENSGSFCKSFDWPFYTFVLNTI